MNKAEAEMLDLGNESQRAGWVQETYLTGDTDALAAKANERFIARVTQLVNEAKQYESLDLPPGLPQIQPPEVESAAARAGGRQVAIGTNNDCGFTGIELRNRQVLPGRRFHEMHGH
jgi:hypothetical protein